MNEIANLYDQLKYCQDLHLHLEGDIDVIEMFEDIKVVALDGIK